MLYISFSLHSSWKLLLKTHYSRVWFWLTIDAVTIKNRMMLRSCMFRWNKTPKDISFAAQHNRHKENMVSLNTITLDTSYNNLPKWFGLDKGKALRKVSRLLKKAGTIILFSHYCSQDSINPVSYTHLTLPTIPLV